MNARSKSAALVCAVCLALAPADTFARELLLVGLDGKTFFRPEGSVNGPNGADGLAIVDITEPARPRVAHVVTGLDTSVYGPPTNLGITPDGRLGLVTSPVTMRQEGGNWWADADDRLFVVDLAADPPAVVQTLRVGRQPSGVAIAPGGDLALVANREGRSVTVLALRAGRAEVAQTVDVGDEAAAVSIVPDGTRALVAKNKAGRVGVLTLKAGRAAYDPALELPAGPGLYGLDVTPDGAFAITAETGDPPSDGKPDPARLIRLGGATPSFAAVLSVGDTLEAVAIAPDGRRAAFSVVRGAAAEHASPTYTREGAVVLVAIEPEGRLRRLAEAPAGAVTQGIAFDPTGTYVYVGNYVDQNLGVYRVSGDAIAPEGAPLPLPGQPASLRGRTSGPR